ncbi:ABC transporter ATP-binding protein [Pseudonocardia nematodicida]|uniref:ABC transporter ATP-binding protein n=1 Tax=Pseudonocardia nematodicida TaxID=1206997 RepID=A0ABV1K5N0_9PSEU
MTPTILDVGGLRAWYGSAQALFGVDLDVSSGEIVGLLGRNGAGKSTTFKAIMGLDAQVSGTVTFDGADISGLPTERIARLGIAWVPPDRRIFPGLSVRENLMLAARAARTPLDLDRLIDAVPLLERLVDREGFQLSGGEQQAVAIARALAGTPRLLLLDEPTEGLAPLVVQQLEASIAALPEKFGVSVLLAEQNLQLVLRLSSRVFVLDGGRLGHEGSADDFAASPELQHRHLSVASAAEGS